MSRHLRTRHNRHEDGPDGPLEDEGFRDDNGIIHTSNRSLRKINYAEIESGFDFLENEDDDPAKGLSIPATDPAEPPLEPTEPTEPAEPTEPEPVDDPNDVYEDDEDDEDVVGNGYRPQNNGHNGRRSRRARSRGRKVTDPEEDDESFHEDDVEEEDDDDEDVDSEGNSAKGEEYYARRRRQREDKNFVVPDPEDDEQENGDEDDDEDISYYRGRRGRGRPKRERSPSPSVNVAKRLRRRTRSAYAAAAVQDADVDGMGHDAVHNPEALSLRDEIRELQDDSPIQEKRSLRERTKPVNYKLPPPLSEATAENYLERQAAANALKNPSPRGRRGGNYNHNAGPARRLFPTGGPFGGNDVTTIFGKNTNFYHQGPPAISGVGNADANNKLILDSDSSEDEILPLGAKPKPKSDNASKRKKKQEIADLDPLGVDMNVKFEDVGGLDNYIDQLKEMVALPLLYPELYQNFDITPPRGVLFHGPPGTGKTLMARALAASCSSEGRKITFFMRKGADVLSKWVGEAERQLRLLFEEAKKQQPSVIFFDEIDGLAPVRSSKQEQIHASIVSTLLALMDGMDNRGQVIVIGATNRPDAVDPALRRPGRFDREFYFPLPDVRGREKIIKIHTKNWKPPLSVKFVQNLATLTKGFGGADLRALCTEAALLSIQRQYPQIYRSNEKLAVDPNKVKVGVKDFMMALKKIVPSSARSSGDAAQPLPDSIKPLLQFQFENIINKIKRILPEDGESNLGKDSSLIQEYLDYEDFYAFGNNGNGDEDDDGDDQGFAKHEMLTRLAESRVCNPKLLITGPAGNGQQYIGAALLHYLEQFNVQRLDLASLLSESTRTIEAAIIQGFIEARGRQPSIVFIPNIDIWSQAVPEAAIFTLMSLFRSLQSNEKVFLLGISEVHKDTNILDGPLSHFEFSDNICHIDIPSARQRSDYFTSIVKILRMKPFEFKTKRRRRKPLPALPPAKSESSLDNTGENGEILSSSEALRRKLKTFQHQDMRLKNILKIKLSGLMDLFKNRYKRFRKPPIEDDYLVHLFEPPTDPNWQPAYTKDNNMILEVTTGRRFFNMDLDIVEERLWNGYYSEPKQYLKDIELIYRDANTMGDRERIIKASEMFANAQMGIEDMSTPDFIRECKATRQRDLERQELFLKDEESRVAAEQKQLTSSEVNPTAGGGADIVGVGDGNQLQAQLRATIPENKEIDDSKINPTISLDFTAPEASEADSPENHDITATGDTTKLLIENSENPESPAEESNKEPEEGKEENGITGSNLDEPSKDTRKNDSQENVPIHINPQVPHIDATGDNNPKDEDDSKKQESTKEVAGNSAENEQMETSSEPNALHTSEEGPEEYSESEDTSKELKIDESALSTVIKLLDKETEGYTVSRLQEIYSRLVDVAWEDRFSWDKSGTIEKILHIVNHH
ncbi:ZYRO0D07414p [Zygosaccharomyces rouxii]|uniref:ZYRO0D07414p n=1 Tax=Zygosaccharomyces rouxii (strain ATCC 2623 / CBS 732 / NBRC 1130 / NCYC 568 / NRRL Y-229) TaxID=559307 RepID=C5DVK4_ZYGRC|nr:uncharacterized protein ZYRO0D07414g [Zygosaccharomyces rouxii]KAH9200735.1 hypothetical protein LQ764DRAFT_98268 [Zygosaccharomyces rouxii]CAR27823.1 ZYRO0D07414p [Zygosaccharomyces rouxii]